MVGIYKITSPSGKVYIGQSRKIEYRRDQYRRLECRNQIKVYNSISKYGWEAHKFEIIHELPQETTQETLNAYETLYWEQYKDCKVRMLNTKGPGSNGKNSRESIDKIAKALIGNKNASGTRSEEFRERCRSNRLGKPSNMLNKKHTKETIDKLKEAKAGKPAKNKVAVAKLDKQGIVIATYESLTEAALKNNIVASTISNNISGLSKTTKGGFIWKHI